ncbi:MAG: 4-hydroxybenzoate octaprenyltransferase [Burkholderiales bacterium]
MTLGERLYLYGKLIRIDRPIGILLLLWPTLWGLWIAGNGRPDAKTVLIFIIGTVLMRSAGCAVNDFADRDFDPHVARTKARPLAAGRIMAGEALGVAATLALLAFLLILPYGRLVVLLSVVAVLLAATYPFTKRFFAVPQAYLGVAFGFGIPLAFAALTGEVPLLAWLLLAANMFWAIAYDTEYAMVDREDDLRIGIKTAAITFGQFDVAAVMLCHAVCLGILAAVGVALGRGLFWFGGLAIAAALAGYQFTLIQGRDPKACFRAFLHNNWVGAVVFAGIAADYLAYP